YAVFSPQLARLQRLGREMHRVRVQASLDCLRQASRAWPSDRAEAMTAYIRGWICHFTLDSLAHPYVYAWERAICQAGVAGLGLDAHSEVHAQIETDLDAMLLYQRTGQTIRTFRPMSEILHGSDELLGWIGVMYRRVAAEVFDIQIADNGFRRAVKDMRTTYALLYSPGGVKRVMIGRLERLARPHSLLQALSHRGDVGANANFDNHEHAAWVNATTGQTSWASFLDIFQSATELAIQRQQLYSSGADSAELLGALNFEGSWD
ncbi:MAG: peptidase, partial [Actinomycetia bacterium]|nr:peptidase [Actinomycetes bacterium]